MWYSCITVEKEGVSKVFKKIERSLLCSQRLHSFCEILLQFKNKCFPLLQDPLEIIICLSDIYSANILIIIITAENSSAA